MPTFVCRELDIPQNLAAAASEFWALRHVGDPSGRCGSRIRGGSGLAKTAISH